MNRTQDKVRGSINYAPKRPVPARGHKSIRHKKLMMMILIIITLTEAWISSFCGSKLDGKFYEQIYRSDRYRQESRRSDLKRNKAVKGAGNYVSK